MCLNSLNKPSAQVKRLVKRSASDNQNIARNYKIRHIFWRTHFICRLEIVNWLKQWLPIEYCEDPKVDIKVVRHLHMEKSNRNARAKFLTFVSSSRWNSSNFSDSITTQYNYALDSVGWSSSIHEIQKLTIGVYCSSSTLIKPVNFFLPQQKYPSKNDPSNL